MTNLVWIHSSGCFHWNHVPKSRTSGSGRRYGRTERSLALEPRILIWRLRSLAVHLRVLRFNYSVAPSQPHWNWEICNGKYLSRACTPRVELWDYWSDQSVTCFGIGLMVVVEKGQGDFQREAFDGVVLCSNPAENTHEKFKWAIVTCLSYGVDTAGMQMAMERVESWVPGDNSGFSKRPLSLRRHGALEYFLMINLLKRWRDGDCCHFSRWANILYIARWLLFDWVYTSI